MSDQQTVVDTTEARAKPADEVTDSARDDVDQLDALLAEYDQGTKKSTESPADTKPAPQTEEIATKVQVLQTQIQEWAADRHKRAISETINDIRGEVPTELFDDEMVEAWLDAQARKDPRLANAFLQREQNPRQWGKVKTELSKQLAQKVGKLPDKAATEDREAVTAAVRRASTQVATEPAPKMGSMSNAEYRKTVREQYGFDPGV